MKKVCNVTTVSLQRTQLREKSVIRQRIMGYSLHGPSLRANENYIPGLDIINTKYGSINPFSKKIVSFKKVIDPRTNTEGVLDHAIPIDVFS